VKAYEFHFVEVWKALPYLTEGAVLTVGISFLAMLGALVIGLAFALASQARWRPVRGVVTAYVEVFRNTPLLIQIFFLYFGLPIVLVKLPAFGSGLLALTLYGSAYNCEVFRAGLEAVPHGQREAARSTGLTPWQEARYVIVPQALRISFPALGNNLVSLVKNSSLVSAIGMVELMFVANDISFNNFRSFEVYGAAVAYYMALVLGLSRLLAFLERRVVARPVA
jgi:polar amino acid transport system permease protein/polar amino acid transport system substrate-binding protein